MTKKRTNILVVAFMTLVFFIAAMLCVNSISTTKRVYASNAITDETQIADDDFYMYATSVYMNVEGASGKTGLRFEGIVSPKLYDSVINNTEENVEKSFGALIIPNDSLGGIDVTSGEYLDAINKNSLSVLVFKNLEGTPVYKANGELHYYVLKSAITSVKYNNIPRDFFGLMFIKTDTSVTDDETGETTVKTTYEYADPNGANVQNLAYTASVAYTKAIAGMSDMEYTETDMLVLRNFVEQAWYKANETDSADAGAAIAKKEYLAKEMEAAKKALFLDVKDTYDLWADIRLASTAEEGEEAASTDSEISLGLYKAYKTSNEAVATVDENGKITAVANGTATITVYCMEEKVEVSVTVGEPTPAITYAEITSYYLNDSTLSISDDWTVNSTSITATGTRNYGGAWNDAMDLWLDRGKGEEKIIFTVTNNSSNTLYLWVFFAQDLSTGQHFYDTYTVSEVTATDGISAAIGTSNKDGFSCTISGETTTTFTVILQECIETDTARIRFSPYVNNSFVGNFTVSNIYFGTGSASTGTSYLSVTAEETDGGKALPDVSKAVEGEKIYLDKAINEGYDFTNYTVESASGEIPVQTTASGKAYFVMPNENVTVSVATTKKKYTLTVADDLKERITIGALSGTTYEWDTLIGIVFTDEKNQYRITGATYTIDGSEEKVTVEGTTFKMPMANITITEVSYVSLYSLSYTTDEVMFMLGDKAVTYAAEGDEITVKSTQDGVIITELTFADGTVVNYTSGNTFIVGDTDVVLTKYDFEETTYEVTASVTPENGCTVAFDKESYEEGATVTVTLTVADGYTVSEIKATYEDNGEEKELTLTESETESNVYTFTQPAANVTVSVTVDAQSKVNYAEISDITTNNMDYTNNGSSVVVTTKNDWTGQIDNCIVAKVIATEKTKTINFTITNNSSDYDLYLNVGILKTFSYYTDGYTVTDVTGGVIGTGRNNQQNAAAELNVIKKINDDGTSNSMNVSITISEEITEWDIILRPQYSSNKFTGSLTMSNIHFE